jgi:hypothetical protein
LYNENICGLRAGQRYLRTIRDNRKCEQTEIAGMADSTEQLVGKRLGDRYALFYSIRPRKTESIINTLDYINACSIIKGFENK